MTPRRTVLITGGTAGLGAYAAASIANGHPDWSIVLCSRSNTNDAAATVNRASGLNTAGYMKLDLSSLAKVRAFVKEYESKGYPPIQILLLNAAIQFPAEVQYNNDNMEKTFATNLVGHALLFHLLRPHLADDARIVVTSSGTHDPAIKTGMPDPKYTSAEELAHPNPVTTTKDGRQRYTTSKLCNILWMYALHRRLEEVQGNKITVNAYDPGLMPGTGLAREYPVILRFLWFRIMPHIIPLLRRIVDPNIRSPKESGALLSRIAVSEQLKGVTGSYFEAGKERGTSKDSHIVANQEDLWNWTVNRVAESEEEKRQFNSFGDAK